MSKMIKSFKSDLSNGEIDKLSSKIGLFLEVCEKESLFLEDIKANIVSLGDYNFLFLEISMLEKPNKKFPARAGVLIIKEARNSMLKETGCTIELVKTKREAVKASLNHMFSHSPLIRIMVYNRDSWNFLKARTLSSLFLYFFIDK